MPAKNNVILMLTIILVATLMQISTDIYTPSLPAIAHSLQTTLGQAQLTMAYFIGGVAVTNLIYGPLSEGIGRRWTIIIGCSIAIIGTLLCLFALNIHMMQIGRLIQGCGLGATASLWRSIFRDSFSGKELAAKSAYLVNFVILSVILAPFIGGYIQQYIGWHGNFLFLLAWTVVVLIFMFFIFKESSQHHGTHRLNLKFVGQSYSELLRNRLFMGFSLMVFLSYGGLFAWMTAGPVILIHGAGIKPVQFGYVMIASGVATALSGYANKFLLKKMSLIAVTSIGLALMSLSGIFLGVAYFIFGLHVIVVIIPAVLFVFGSTFIFMNCFVLGFENVGHIAGYAGSVYACIQQLGGAVFGSILGHLSTNSPLPMAIMFTASGLGAWIMFLVFAAPAHRKYILKNEDNKNE